MIQCDVNVRAILALGNIYLYYDAIRLIKNIRNNLLNQKKFVFPLSTYNRFVDPINVSGGELKWKMFLHIFERDT